jgi:undecaprenyl-diphosphatase
MNGFDLGLLHFLNQFAHRSPRFDHLMWALSDLIVFKGLFVVGVFWWLWFRPGRKNASDREIVVATLAAAVLSVIVGRLLADFLPFRTRPLQTPGLDFVAPYGVIADGVRGWSSFPSDHAMVFFAISTGLWFVSRRLGVAAFIYVLLVIALPRMYIGYHYPTDILAGAVIGMVFAWMANQERVRRRISHPAFHWLAHHPPSFYTCFFLFCEELSSLFNPVRNLAHVLLSLVA